MPTGTPAQSVGSGTGALAVSADLHGLSPGLVYRLAASDSPWGVTGNQPIVLGARRESPRPGIRDAPTGGAVP